MGASENLALHRRWADAEDRHDISHHDEFLHPDIVVHLPGGEQVVGLAAYMDMMNAQYGVVCRWRVSGRHSGDFSGVPPTGRHIEFPGVSVWEFADGKAARGWVLPDIASLMGQVQA
jgi:predicted ester cyclase